MAELPASARVVVIGGGAVGASCLYHLAKAGWSDCVLLEKNELTSGSTWHAAGNIPTFSASWSVMNMQRYSTELYRGLGEAVDYPMNYHVSGSIRLAHSSERMQEFERVAGMGRYQGIDIEMCSLDDLKRHYPFLETHDLTGGLYDPTDGDIDPAQLTQALAKGARDMGAQIIRFCAVEGVEWTGDEWIVRTNQGAMRAEYVVNAAGYRAQEVGRMFGREVPMMTMSHQYLLTEELPELQTWSAEHGGKLPLLRDVDSSYYLRQEKHGFNLGPYENNCRGHWMSADDPMPDDFSFQLWDEDLERISWHIEDAMARVPLLGASGVGRVVNGPIPYTPDGLPLIGPMPGVPNAFEACVFTFGIAQAGGAGKVLAEWITEGGTEWDMWSCDPRRFTGFEDQDYCNKKGMEVYGHEYAMHFPQHEWPAARDKKCSPNDATLRELGAQMGAYNGWERANWFAKAGDDTSEAATHTWSRKGPWQPRIQAEVEAVRDSVGVLDLAGFSRFNITGASASDWLNGQIAGALPKPGRLNLAYFPDHRGRIHTEMSVFCHSAEHYTLITAATAQLHDYELLRQRLPTDGSISLVDHTNDYSTLIVCGPQSRELFAALAPDADLSLPWLSHQSATVAGRSAALARVSFAGELGWEIHASIADSPAIYQAVLAAGATPFGMYALNSMRIEKGYRTWKGDLSTDYTVLQAGLGRFVKLDKEADFPGKAAMQAEALTESPRTFATLIIDCDEFDAPYMANVWQGDTIVGEVTSGAYGYRVGAALALTMLERCATAAGTQLEVDIYGTRYPATVAASSALWDPKNERIRA